MARTTERTVALSELNLRGVIVNTTSSATLYPSDSGITYVNTYVGNVEYTLPAVADAAGKMFLFVNADDGNMKITSPAADINAYHATPISLKTSVEYSTNPEGASCAFISDGTRYLFLNFVGTEPTLI